VGPRASRPPWPTGSGRPGAADRERAKPTSSLPFLPCLSSSGGPTGKPPVDASASRAPPRHWPEEPLTARAPEPAGPRHARPDLRGSASRPPERPTGKRGHRGSFFGSSVRWLGVFPSYRGVEAAVADGVVSELTRTAVATPVGMGVSREPAAVRRRSREEIPLWPRRAPQKSESPRSCSTS